MADQDAQTSESDRHTGEIVEHWTTVGPALLLPRVKPVEAMLWTGKNWDHICRWVYGEVVTIPEDWADEGEKWPVVPGSDLDSLSVLEGNDDEATADPGEWLIKTDDGWFVCDQATLNERYTLAVPPSPPSFDVPDTGRAES